LIENLLFQLIQAWALGLVALLAGRYIGAASVKLPAHKGRIFVIYLLVWAVTFFGQLAFGFLGYSLRWSEAAQAGFAEFLLPLVAGAYFARQLMLVQMRREKQRAE
jgi:hypothetical protein